MVAWKTKTLCILFMKIIHGSMENKKLIHFIHENHSPSEQILRQVLLVEAPHRLINRGAHLHGVWTRCETILDHAIGADQELSGQCIDLQCVSKMRLKKFEDRV